MIKKCNWCENTTKASRTDFVEIGWMAIQFGNEKMMCACPEHKKDMQSCMHKNLMERSHKEYYTN